MFFPMVRRGYICYIRNRTTLPTFLKFMELRDNWRKILEVAIEESTSDFKTKYCKSLLKKPLYEILSLNIGTFDWILQED